MTHAPALDELCCDWLSALATAQAAVDAGRVVLTTAEVSVRRSRLRVERVTTELVLARLARDWHLASPGLGSGRPGRTPDASSRVHGDAALV